MELSAELLEATLKALRGDQVEQRKHPRAPARFRVRMFPYRHPTLTDAIDVWTRDISLGGLCFVSYIRFKAGAKFVIRLPRVGGGVQCLLCTVRNCSETVRGVFAIGVSFEELVASNSQHAQDDSHGAAAVPAPQPPHIASTVPPAA